MTTCSFCVRPKVNYISKGKIYCTCGGILDMETADAVQNILAQDRDPRPMITPPPSPPAPPQTLSEMSANIVHEREVLNNYRETRRKTLTRFTRTLGNEKFECGHCKCSRDAAQMMRFADNEALVQTALTDWCGICVKDEIKTICQNKGDFKRVWALLKNGVILPESLLNSSEYVKPAPVVQQDRQVATTTYHNRRGWFERKPEGPPPEIDLVF